jgi:hypothetical protein
LSSDESAADTASIDARIAYHEVMERMAAMVEDFARADHHRNMQDIFRKMKE